MSDMDTREGCFFDFKFNCSQKTEKLISCGPERIKNILKCSKIYCDGHEEKLNSFLDKTTNDILRSHKSCVSSYTSQEKVNRFLRLNPQNDDTRPPKKTRLSPGISFSFASHCLFCGEDCQIEKDSKHPGRWRPAYLCKDTVNTETGKSFKEAIFSICETRSDHWASEVRLN